MRSILLLCFLLLVLWGCKHDDLLPGTYLKALSLGVEPLRDGVTLKWGPAFIFEEGMYETNKPVAPAQYEIYLSEGTEKELRKVAVVDGTVLEYTVRNQPEGKTIYLQVKAIHPQLKGSESNFVTTNTGTLGSSEVLIPVDTPYIPYGAWGNSNLVYVGTNGLFVMRPDGNVHKLKSTGFMPVLSPDGRRVAFLGNRNQNTSYTTQLLVETVESGIVQLLDTKKAIFSAEWSNDGRWLAYVTSEGLWKVSVGDGVRSLINERAWDLSEDRIDWSPDDKFIVTSQKKTLPVTNRYVTNLVRVPATGGNPETLSASDWRDDQPAFSPDGQHLAFISNRSGYAAIWTVDLKTNKSRQVTGIQEQFYYINRLDWVNNTQLTYSARLPQPADISLKKVTLP